MKKIYSIALLALVFILSYPIASNAQDDIDQFLSESAEDGEKLVGAYIAPAIKAFSLGLNQGWYNTAKPHKIAGVDLTASFSLMKVPSSEQLFDANALGLTNITLVNPSTGLAETNGNIPTILGPDNPPTFSPSSTVNDGIVNQSDDFQGPGGLELGDDVKILKNKMPAAMVQLGFGLPKGTDVKLRLVPKVDVGDGKFNMFGIGVMHDVKQYIPGIKNLPFDLSAFVGYTKMKLDVPFDPGQNGVFEVSSTTIQGVISKKVAVLTFYGGLGYNIAKSKLAMLGTYDIGGSPINDPVNLSYAASGFRTTVGMRLKLAVLTFHGDYTLQKYSALTVGVGISVR